VDPLGGASVAYIDAIAERDHLNLEVVNHRIDPTFRRCYSPLIIRIDEGD
jgi:phosphoglucomutase